MASHGGGNFKEYPTWKKMLLSWTDDGAHHVAAWLGEWKFDPIVVMGVMFVSLAIFTYSVDPDAVVATFAVATATSPIWLPISLLVMFWHQWMHYIRFMYWFSPGNQPILLEVQLPPEVTKSPRAMEIFLTSLHQSGGESTFIHRIWRGQMRMVSSLEIASTEGQVRFYIYTRKGWRNIIESRLYGQYPEAQIFEVDDYTKRIPSNLDGYELWGSEFQKGDVGALPIKTYVDFGLDDSPDKPEVQTDPITQIVELLGSIGKDEHFWMQLIIRARKSDEWYGFYLNKNSFAEGAKKALKDITEGAVKRAQELISTGDPLEDKKQKAQAAARGSTLMNEVEREKVKAIERSQSKLLFECGVRVVYLAKKERFVGVNISNIVTFFAAFRGSGKVNNSLGVTRGLANFDFWWQDWNNIRLNIEKRNTLFRYRYRAYFGVPYDQVPVFMNTEELATLWHFPSSVVKTPGLSRVPAKVSEAPMNLPTADSINLPR